MQIDRFEIAKLDLHPGDSVIVRADKPIPPATLEKFQRCLDHFLGFRVLVVALEPGMSIDIMRPVAA